MNGGNAAELAGPMGPLLQLAPFALILVVFYFLLVRPQQKKAKEPHEMLDNLRTGDEVVTSGGLHGRIVKIADKMLMVEIAPKVVVRVERPAITHLVRGTKSSEKAEEKSA